SYAFVAYLLPRPLPPSTLFPYTTLFRSTVNAGVRLLHDTNDEAFVFGVTLPLGAGSRARSGIAAAQAERDETAAQRHAHRVRARSEEHTSELQSRENLVCRLLLEKKKHK